MVIKTLELIGPYAIATASGEKLQSVIRDALQEKGPIILDFTGVKVVTAAFFNSAIAPLIGEFPAERLTEISFRGLTPQGRQVFTHTQKRAQQYYSDPRYQAAVDKVMKDLASGS